MRCLDAFSSIAIFHGTSVCGRSVPSSGAEGTPHPDVVVAMRHAAETLLRPLRQASLRLAASVAVEDSPVDWNSTNAVFAVSLHNSFRMLFPMQRSRISLLKQSRIGVIHSLPSPTFDLSNACRQFLERAIVAKILLYEALDFFAAISAFVSPFGRRFRSCSQSCSRMRWVSLRISTRIPRCPRLYPLIL